MQRTILSALTALAVVVLPQYAAAHEEDRPRRPNPEAIFHRLDADRDGVVTLDEIPPAMPERLKHFIVRVIKSHDGKLTKEGLIEAVKRHRQCRRSEGGPHAPRPLNARTVFNRLDKDKDGKLSFEEFSAGLRRLHKALARRASTWSMLVQADMVRFAREKMSTYGPKFVKCSWAKAHPDDGEWTMGYRHHHGKQWAMGHERPDGRRQRGMGHWRPDGDEWIMGYRHHHGKQWARGHERPDGRRQRGMGHWRPDGDEWIMGYRHHEGRQWDMGHERHEGRGWFEGQRRHEGKGWFEDQRPEGKKKPKMKKPKSKYRKSAEKASTEKRTIKARLALEREQAEIISLEKAIAEKRTIKARLAFERQRAELRKAIAEKRTIKTRLVALERQQAEIISLLRATMPEHKTKGLAKPGKKAKHRERKPHSDDRD